MIDILIIRRLLLSVLLGGLIGLEREIKQHAAGLRTHILVSVGSCLITICSMYGFSEVFGMEGIAASRDPARIAAQIVSGIGFLGAGTILREGMTVKGLTTAASLWAVAGIGLSVGAGLEMPAVATAVIVILSLVLLSKFEKKVLLAQHFYTYLKVEDKPGKLGLVASELGKYGVNIKRMELEPTVEEEGYVAVEMGLVLPRNMDQTALFNILSHIDGVVTVKFRTEH
jgi:putative Mg2+ transporter-C (MgtC) family protein